MSDSELRYKIVLAELAHNLVSLVMKDIALGWEPIGGVCVASAPDSIVEGRLGTIIKSRTLYAQAMVKRGGD